MSTVDGVIFNNPGASFSNTQSQNLTVDEETLTVDEETLTVDEETLTVDEETLTVDEEILTVDEETVNNIWALTDTQNVTLTDGERKTQFFYRYMREQFINLEKNIDRKKLDVKDTWIDIYQLIGFFSVFQGVWFQGVTQLVAQRTCRFYIIPVVLSVLVSVSTLVGCFFKFKRLGSLHAAVYNDGLQSTVLKSRLSGFGRYGLKFSLKGLDESLEGSVSALTVLYEEQLVKAHQSRMTVLAGMAIFSGLFAWLIYAIMCDEFP